MAHAIGTYRTAEFGGVYLMSLVLRLHLVMLFERKTAKIPNSERGGMVLFYEWVF